MSEFSSLIDSTAELRNTSELKVRMQREGYLFFPRLIDPARALSVKHDIVSILREHHIIEDDGDPEPMWSGGPFPTEPEYMAVYDKIARLESFQQLAESREIANLLDALCGEPVHVWQQRLIRIVYPDPEASTAKGVGAHQDGDPKLGYRADTFYTGWIALMEIDRTIGGLAVAPRSHTMGFLKSAGTVASSYKASAKQRDFGLDASQLDWATADFAPGSTVIFINRMVHRGLPNYSDRIRLSCDYRYQGASGSASWLAHTLGPDVRRVAHHIDEVIASRALYVTTRASAETLDEVRRRMLEEQNTTLARAQQLVGEIHQREKKGAS